MTVRTTLPQQRAQETRKRIIDAARAVFGRAGYGQSAVEEILLEAGISRGAFYHHFSSKEELFRALLEDHLDAGLRDFGVLGQAGSPREQIDRFVVFLINDMRSHLDSEGLPYEFLAQATREDWAREPLSEFHGRTHNLIAGVLRAGQAQGGVRADLDVDAAAWLLLAVSEGLCAFKAVDNRAFDLDVLARPWGDLIERFVVNQQQIASGDEKEESS